MAKHLMYTIVNGIIEKHQNPREKANIMIHLGVDSHKLAVG